jgi:hypothetical protein
MIFPLTGRNAAERDVNPNSEFPGRKLMLMMAGVATGLKPA